jgi:arylsulfatase A-like enzyme
VPMLVRWPGKIKPGQISNEIVQHHDWFPTFLAMAGDLDVVAAGGTVVIEGDQ